MSTNTEASSGSSLDWLKWLVVVALLGGGVYGNWYFQDEWLLWRVIGLIALAALAGFIAVQTERGLNTWNLIKESRGEVRRVVWPTYPETHQTTGVVLILVLIFALILWALDALLGSVISSVIG